jgi:predicted glycogen debranching enzyme
MMPTAAHFRPESYEQGTSREWLVTNGLGGYASATAIGCNTRAYHGLLVAALTPPGNRRLLLSSLDEEINGQKLANHKYPGVVHPQGFRYLQEFWIDPIPDSVINLHREDHFHDQWREYHHHQLQNT